MASIINASNTGFGGLIETGDSSGQLQLQTAGTAALTIDSSQNVGVGTTSPTSFGANTRGITLDGTGNYQHITWKVNGTVVADAYTNGASGFFFGTEVSAPLQFQTGGTERMRIDSSGNVGIGTTSITRAYANYNQLNINGTSGATIQLLRNGTEKGNIIADSDALYLQGSAGMIFGVGSTGAGTERMRIDSSGNVLVGTTNGSSTAGVGIKFNTDASGQVVQCVTSATTNGGSTNYNYYSTGAAAYRFYVGAGGTVYATATTITGISDQRVKENIVDLDEGLDAVMALKPRKFDWKEGKGKDIKGDRGFIAQEFETVFPDMIEEWKDEPPEGEEPYKAVNANLIPTLVKAIQELKAELDELKAKVNA